MMKMPWSDLEGPAKFIAICVTVFLIAGGLCGLQWIVVANINSGSALIQFAMTTGIAELAAMILAILGVIGGICAWIIRSIRGADPPATKNPQTLFGSDERDDDHSRQ